LKKIPTKNVGVKAKIENLVRFLQTKIFSLEQKYQGIADQCLGINRRFRTERQKPISKKAVRKPKLPDRFFH